jgi:hypothetical protein
MSERTVFTSLRPSEWEVVCRLRDVPGGPLREEVLDIVTGLLRFAAAPTCSRAQSDGVPCASVQASCDECRLVATYLARLRGMVQPVAVEGPA